MNCKSYFRDRMQKRQYNFQQEDCRFLPFCNRQQYLTYKMQFEIKTDMILKIDNGGQDKLILMVKTW